MDVDGPRLGGDEVRAREDWGHSRRVATVLIVLLAAGVAAGAWALTRPESTVQQHADARPDAVAAASRFAANVNTYDVAQLTEYDARVTPLLTTTFGKQFKASTQGLLAAYAKTELKSTGKVRQAAVESIDSDSAKVLVAVDAETDPAGLLTNPPRLRWQVSLVKQHDRWLVDDFTSVDPPALHTKGSNQ
jgi:Mce-associated membrane protein